LRVTAEKGSTGAAQRRCLCGGAHSQLLFTLDVDDDLAAGT
jgi:hypothetical protein